MSSTMFECSESGVASSTIGLSIERWRACETQSSTGCVFTIPGLALGDGKVRYSALGGRLKNKIGRF